MAAASSSPTISAPASSSSSPNSTSSSRAAAFLSFVRPCNYQSSFFGVGLSEAGVKPLHPDAKRKSISLAGVRARTASAGRTIEVEVDKPLGLTLGQKSGGGVIISAVDGAGNAAKAGLKAGDQVIYTSSFFGDELWPADKLGFTKTAIQAKADSVYFVVSRGAEVDVKKLTKRPAPPRFGRKLTDAQKARATHICLDCGYIYTMAKPFEEQPDTFECPQCSAPKKRFARYDAQTGRAAGGTAPPISVILGVVVGAAAVAALVFYGLQ